MKEQMILDNPITESVGNSERPVWQHRNLWTLGFMVVGATWLAGPWQGLPVRLWFNSVDMPIMSAWFPAAEPQVPYRWPEQARQSPPQPVANLRRGGIELVTALYAARHNGLVPEPPDVDVCEDESETVLLCDMPGARPSEIEVEFADGELTIFGAVSEQARARKWIAREYAIDEYYRRFVFDSAVDVDRITASASDGVLTIRLPRPDRMRPHRIAVKLARA